MVAQFMGNLKTLKAGTRFRMYCWNISQPCWTVVCKKIEAIWCLEVLKIIRDIVVPNKLDYVIHVA